MLVLSTNDGPVSTGLPPPRSLPLVRFSHSDVDGQVALHVGLLVDRELDLLVLDRVRGVGVQVERGDLGLAAGVRLRLRARERVAARRG